MKYMIAVGTLNEGWHFIGPYDSFDAAEKDDQWYPWPSWICPIHTREDYENEFLPPDQRK
jgi:hypothetical protein